MPRRTNRLQVFFSIAFLTLCLLAGCQVSSSPAVDGKVSLTVFAAASLTEAFSEIAPLFEASHPEIHLIYSFGASNLLVQQILQDAPADVFASANLKQMDVLLQAERVVPAGVQTFASNELVVILPGANSAGINRLEDLQRPGIKLIVAAEEVPVGQYTLEFLQRASQDEGYGSQFSSRVMNNIVSYEENVKAVVSKVVLDEADAGIVYRSDGSQANRERLKIIPIPDALNIQAAYPISRLQNSPHPEQAQAFIDFVLSPAGQDILEKNGFIPVR